MDDHFVEYFDAAQMEALKGRDLLILQYRFDTATCRIQTLQEIGVELGVTRERIRQLLRRAIRRIRHTARRQIRAGQTDAACAQLLLFLERQVEPGTPQEMDRLVSFVLDHLVYFPPTRRTLALVAALTYPTEKIAEAKIAEAAPLLRQKVRTSASIRQSEYRGRRRQQVLDELLAATIWPSHTRVIDKLEKNSLRPIRDVSPDGSGLAGTFYSNKLDRAVQFESSLEFDFLLRLEEAANVAFYCEQPLEVPYDHAGRARRYYPDLFLRLADGRGVVVEIKPTYQMALRENLTKWSALRRFCNERGWGLLVTDGRRTIQEVQRRHVDKEFRHAVISALRTAPLSWMEYTVIRDAHDASYHDLVALVLQERLTWTLGPFRLFLSENEHRTKC